MWKCDSALLALKTSTKILWQEHEKHDEQICTPQALRNTSFCLYSLSWLRWRSGPLIISRRSKRALLYLPVWPSPRGEREFSLKRSGFCRPSGNPYIKVWCIHWLPLCRKSIIMLEASAQSWMKHSRAIFDSYFVSRIIWGYFNIRHEWHKSTGGEVIVLLKHYNFGGRG